MKSLVLADAIKLLQQGYSAPFFAADANGYPVDAMAPTAAAWDGVGAVVRAANCRGEDMSDAWCAMDAATPLPCVTFLEWQDAYAPSRAQVIDVMKRAGVWMECMDGCGHLADHLAGRASPYWAHRDLTEPEEAQRWKLEVSARWARFETKSKEPTNEVGAMG